MTSERAILASLDANLQLAVRMLPAEHPSLSDNPLRRRTSRSPHQSASSPTPCTGSFAGYRAATKRRRGP
jgi:hypothetical protein